MPPKAPKKMTVDEIYEAIKKAGSIQEEQEATDEMGDLLHQLNTTPRPSNKDEVEKMCSLIFRLALCGSDPQSWKRLVLVITRRRYHLKSPEAKASEQESAEGGPKVAGDGERLFFYVATTCLYYIGCASSGVNNASKDLACSATVCLCRISLQAGGSRDACSLLEQLIHAAIPEYLQLRKDSTHAKALATAIHGLLSGTASAIETDRANEPIRYLLGQVADTLTKDLKLVRGEVCAEIKTEGDAGKDEGRQSYMSTLNVFVPHNDRGSSKSRDNSRKLVQCVAEALLWSRNEVALADPSFAAALNSIRSMDMSCATFESDVINQLHKMQTIIRRLRKELNSAARDQGFMVRDQFLIDPSKLTIKQIKKGKSGDVTELTRLAKKANNKRVLELISSRLLDENKAIPVESINQLRSQWVTLVPCRKDGAGVEDDDLRHLHLAVQRATVKATISDMSKRLAGDSLLGKGKITIVSEGRSILNHASALLVGAAMCQPASSSEVVPEGEKPKKIKYDAEAQDESKAEDGGQNIQQSVIIHGEECEVSSLDGVIGLLDELFSEDSTKFTSRSADDTLKNIMNAVDRHAQQNGRVLIFVQDKPELPERYLRTLQERNCKVHCHLGNDLQARLQREDARLGDITCSLAWDTYDDLDIHVIPPSGNEIYYGNRKSDEGVLDVDMNAGSNDSLEPVENVYFGDIEKGLEAPHGKYKVYVQNYSYHTEDRSAKIFWRVSIRMDNKTTNYEGFCVGCGAESNSTVAEFEYTGRTAPMEDELPKSAGDSASIINITTSVGFTRDALCQLVNVWDDHEEISRVKELAIGDADETNEEQEMGPALDGADGSNNDQEMEPALDDADGSNNNQEMTSPQSDDDDTISEQPQVQVSQCIMNVTSQDRLNLQLFKLPQAFHSEVESIFGGSSLVEACAAEVASRLAQENIRVSALSVAGYPKDIIEMVKDKMKTFTMKK